MDYGRYSEDTLLRRIHDSVGGQDLRGLGTALLDLVAQEQEVLKHMEPEAHTATLENCSPSPFVHAESLKDRIRELFRVEVE